MKYLGTSAVFRAPVSRIAGRYDAFTLTQSFQWDANGYRQLATFCDLSNRIHRDLPLHFVNGDRGELVYYVLDITWYITDRV